MRNALSIVSLSCILALSACTEQPEPDADETTLPTVQDGVGAAPGDVLPDTPAAVSDGMRGRTARLPRVLDPGAENPSAALRMTTGPVVYLVDAAGQAVYMLEGNTDGSKCGRICEEVWPPVLATSTRPEAGKGVDSQMIGIAARGGDAFHVTYGNNPLYRYVGDQGAMRTTGHGVRDRWGLWSLVGLQGGPVTDPLPEEDEDMASPAGSGTGAGQR